MEQYAPKSVTNDDNHNKVTEDGDAEFYDAFEEFPFVDVSDSFESDQSLSVSEIDSNNNNDDDDANVSIISDHTPESPSSPSSAGLRHRRLVSQQSCKEYSRSQFFKNNPDGLVDFDLHGTTVSPGKKYERSWSLKDNEKLNGKLNSTTVHPSSGSVGKQLKEETDGSSVITSVNNDERIEDESVTVDSANSAPDFLFTLAKLLIKVIGFQTNLLASCVTFPIWLMYSSYMFVTDPFGLMRSGRNYMLGNISGIWRICYDGAKWIVYLWIKKHEPIWKLCFRMGRGLLWLAYFGFILIGLLVPALLLSGIMMKWIVEEPIQITEQLTFDYTRDNPMAFVPITSCPESSSLEHSEKSMIGSTAESRVIPFDHELQATVSLTLPESDYNRNLGIFQVRVDFLSGNGKPLASTRQPSMLQFKSQPIRLLSTFFKLAPLLTGYSSETQTLDIKFRGYTERDVHTSCLRVVIEQRAEFARGGGVPEMYAASLKIESQLPFLKRILWYWKGMIYMWISIMMFTVELLFALLCCTPMIFPWLRPGGVSSNNNASRNTHPGRS